MLGRLIKAVIEIVSGLIKFVFISVLIGLPLKWFWGFPIDATIVLNAFLWIVWQIWMIENPNFFR